MWGAVARHEDAAHWYSSRIDTWNRVCYRAEGLYSRQHLPPLRRCKRDILYTAALKLCVHCPLLAHSVQRPGGLRTRPPAPMGSCTLGTGLRRAGTLAVPRTPPQMPQSWTVSAHRRVCGSRVLLFDVQRGFITAAGGTPRDVEPFHSGVAPELTSGLGFPNE